MATIGPGKNAARWQGQVTTGCMASNGDDHNTASYNVETARYANVAIRRPRELALAVKQAGRAGRCGLERVQRHYQ